MRKSRWRPNSRREQSGSDSDASAPSRRRGQRCRLRIGVSELINRSVVVADMGSPANAPLKNNSERRGWLGVISVALGSFVLVLSEFLPIGLLPAISSDLDIGIGTGGLMVVATGLAAAVSSPVVTVLTPRIDRRTVIWSLTVLLVLADMVGALAVNFPMLLGSRLLLGIALGGFWAIGAGLAGRLVSATSVIRATSFITAGISVATVVSLPLGSFISSASSWRTAFVIAAVLGILALAGQLVLLPRISARERVRFSTFRMILAVPRARVGLIATAFVFLAQFAAYTYVAQYLKELVRIDSATITSALLVLGVAGVAGNFIAGFALARCVTATVTVVQVGLVISLVSLPLLAGSIPGVVVLLVFWGLVWGALPLGMQTWMSQGSIAAPEGSLALFVTTIQLAIAGGSVVGGIAVSTIGLATDFYLAAGIAAIGVAFLLSLNVRSPRSAGGRPPAVADPQRVDAFRASRS